MKAKKIVHKFFELDRKDRKMYMLQMATIRTIGVALIKFFFGIAYASIWFFTNSIFYIILGISKYRSVRDYRKVKKIKDKRAKERITYNNYLYNGWLLVLLGVAYFIINLIIYKTGQTNNDLDGYLVYLTAFFSFSSLISASISLYKYKIDDDPIIAAACQGNIAKALASIVLTQVTLLDQFAIKDIKIVRTNGTTGMVVGVIIMILGFRMIIKIVRRKSNFIGGRLGRI